MTAPARLTPCGKYAPYANEAHGHVCRETQGLATRRSHTFKNARRRRLRPYDKLLDYWWEVVNTARWETPAERLRVTTELRDSAFFLLWALDDMIEFADTLPRRKGR